MSEILKVLNKKVELKSEVVELGIAQEISKKIKQLQKNGTAFRKSVNLRKTAEEKEEVSYQDLRFAINQSEEVLADFAKQAKDLGIDPTKQSDYKLLKGAVNGESNNLKNR